MRKSIVCILVGLGFVVAAQASVITAPNTIAEDPPSSGANTPIRNAARTMQTFFDESQFAAITEPVRITGMQFRIAANGGNVTGDWPSSDITFANYDVQLSRAAPPVRAAGHFPNVATPFADNQDGTVTLVRSGPLTITSGSFPNSQPANQIRPFAFSIAFTTPYLYQPGQELLLTLRHTGYGSGPAQAFVASIVSTQDVVDTVFNSSYTATVPSGGGASPFVQFTYEQVPEPSALTFAAAMLLVRRRRAC
jgi:hypothetical protein